MVKKCVGIDVSKDFLDCCLGYVDPDGNLFFEKSKRFNNNQKGFQELLNWCNYLQKNQQLSFVMEATGVYYEGLAYFLNDRSCLVSVLLPNMVKNYNKSLNVKTKTDRKDAEILSRLGLERKLKNWYAPLKIMRDLKFLSREYRDTKDKINQVKNQLHARDHSYECPINTQKRLVKQIRLLETHTLEIEAELRTIAMSDSQFYDKVQCVCSIPGISFITAICIIAETNGFALISNAKQLVSYSGLDIQHNQSGQKEGKTKISKKGNSYIRCALYMPALCATRHNPVLKTFYSNLCSRKPAKKIAVTAVARKLLILIYVLWKNNAEFDKSVGTLEKVDRISPAYAG